MNSPEANEAASDWTDAAIQNLSLSQSPSPSPRRHAQSALGSLARSEDSDQSSPAQVSPPATRNVPDKEDSPTTDRSPLPTQKSDPVSIPTVPIHRRDPDRVQTPTSGRGSGEKGSYFPYSRTTSPSPTDRRYQAIDDQLEDISRGRLYRRNSASTSDRLRHQLYHFRQHTHRMAARYTPTSPLSPRMHTDSTPLSPQPQARSRTHKRQESSGLRMNLPRYHPLNFKQSDTHLLKGASQNPNITLTRAPPATIYGPHIRYDDSAIQVRERQAELMRQQETSSKLAASPLSVKPGAPKLDPLGSPKGPVTPLELEGGDYFALPKSPAGSPAVSPGSKSDGSVTEAPEPQRRRKRGSKDRATS